MPSSRNGLYQYGAGYNPTDARWTQPDPLNQAADLRHGNRYGYGYGYVQSGQLHGSNRPVANRRQCVPRLLCSV